MKIIVIGAGLAGLTAAYRLQQAGFSVSLLEREQIPGGRMAETNTVGLNYPTGARLIYSSSKSVMGLIREFDLSSQLCSGLKVPVSASSLSGEHLVQMTPQFNLLHDLTKSYRQRWCLFQMGVGLVCQRLTTNPDRLLDWRRYDDITLAKYLRQRSLDEISKIHIEPIFRGARGWRMTDISPAFFLSTTAHMYGAHAYTFEDGIGLLTKRLAQDLDVTYCVDVKYLSRTVTGDSKVGYDAEGSLKSANADVVICAIPGSLALRIVSDPKPEEIQFLKAVKYSSGHILHFGIDRSIDPYVTFFSSDVNDSIAAVEVVDQSRSSPSFITRVSIHLAPELVMKLETGQALGGELSDVLDDLPDQIAGHLDHYDGEITQQRIENMLPLFYPGYLKELSTFEKYQASGKKQIYYAGDYMSHALLGGACQSGEAVAQAIIAAYSV